MRRRVISDISTASMCSKELLGMWVCSARTKCMHFRQRCNEVFSRVFMIREDIDIGWSMIGLDTQANPMKDLQSSVNHVVQAMRTLRESELVLAHDVLGYKQDGRNPCTNAGPSGPDELHAELTLSTGDPDVVPELEEAKDFPNFLRTEIYQCHPDWQF